MFESNGLEPRAIARIASVDLKRDETGLIEAAESLGAKTAFFTAGELNAAPGAFSESDFVRETVGTGCVCERAAVLAGGDLIVNKTVTDGVTAAVAREKWGIVF